MKKLLISIVSICLIFATAMCTFGCKRPDDTIEGAWYFYCTNVYQEDSKESYYVGDTYDDITFTKYFVLILVDENNNCVLMQEGGYEDLEGNLATWEIIEEEEEGETITYIVLKKSEVEILRLKYENKMLVAAHEEPDGKVEIIFKKN